MENKTKEAFHGHEKHLVHFLVHYERMFLKAAVPLVPPWVHTSHLTLMTLVWSGCTVAAGYWAALGNLQWLWLFDAAILLQYITDMLDGDVGRRRDSGLLRWGFYMDHFLDYVFLSSIVIGYSFLLPPSERFWALGCLAASAGFMVHAFMDFSITSNFKISCKEFGVSEVRFALIIFNILLMCFGKALLINIFPFVVIASLAALAWLVVVSQKAYAHMDTLQQARRDETVIPEKQGLPPLRQACH
jgi:phosphatidylglycerophosphate synthase